MISLFEIISFSTNFYCLPFLCVFTKSYCALSLHIYRFSFSIFSRSHIALSVRIHCLPFSCIFAESYCALSVHIYCFPFFFVFTESYCFICSYLLFSLFLRFHWLVLLYLFVFLEPFQVGVRETEEVRICLVDIVKFLATRPQGFQVVEPSLLLWHHVQDNVACNEQFTNNGLLWIWLLVQTSKPIVLSSHPDRQSIAYSWTNTLYKY